MRVDSKERRALPVLPLTKQVLPGANTHTRIGVRPRAEKLPVHALTGAPNDTCLTPDGISVIREDRPGGARLFSSGLPPTPPSVLGMAGS